MKKILFLLFVLSLNFVSFQSNAQAYTLEQVDMSPDANTTYDTYVMDINNRAYTCGYFTNSLGDNIGYVITRKGVEFHFDNTVTGSFDNKVVSINDNDVALLSTTTAGVTTLWKVYMYDEDYYGPVQVTGLGQNPVNALKINNKNDISGWYQGVNSRWLFILHDSIIPPAMPAWQASRYMVGPTYYNTWGCGMDTNNYIAGFYLDAPNYYPFLHNATANTYQLLTAPAKTKVWDMNNSHVMVGEYQQGNGTYMAFWGDITGNTLNVNSLANIFHNNTIQSVANGINDKGFVVGNFVDPNTGKWKGFIYRPGLGHYEHVGYNFPKYTWNFRNDVSTTPGNTTEHWNKDFFDQYVNYDLSDHYVYAGFPLNDSNIINTYCNPTIPNTLHPDWQSFATETDKLFTPNGTQHDKNMYKYFKKYKMFDKYVNYISKTGGLFVGDCFGFTTLSMMYYSDPNSINAKFGIPLNINLSSINNMDSVCKRAIVRGQLQYDNPVLLDKYENIYIKPWHGAFRTKTYMSDTLQKVNLRTINFSLVDINNDTGGHAVFPYKIITPKKLPFKNPVTLVNEADTMMVYDPNFPMDSTQYLAMRYEWNYTDTGLYSPSYNAIAIYYEQPTFTELESYPFAALKKLRANDTVYNFCFSPNTDYIIANGGFYCSLVNNVYANYIQQLKPHKGIGPKATRPLYFRADSLDTYSINLKNYQDSAMSITHTTDDLGMGINRNALPGQNDNFTVGRKKISYGNPENISKEINCHFVQTHDGATKSVYILAKNLSVSPNDSIVTLTPYDYSYQIIHPSGGNISYNLQLVALYTDTIKQFVANLLPLNTNSSHLIDPYYLGPNGSQTVIYVDDGLNGNNDDTLFVQEVPLGSVEAFKNVSYVNLFPNPVQKELSISIQENQQQTYTIIVADMFGKIINRQNIEHTAGKSTHTVVMNNKTAGIYYVILYDKNQKALFMEKVIKE